MVTERMSFSTKKVGEIPAYSSWKDLFKPRFFVKTGAVLLSVAVILGIGKLLLHMLPQTTAALSRATAQVVSKQIGEPMVRDEYGNINIMIVGYAGNGYRGGLLTDTIMLASYNPEIGAVTFLSVPRDLYVNYGEGRTGKINGMYRNKYIASDNDPQIAADALREKMMEITGIEIPYYAMVDFDGFVKFVDYIGGIEVDVPYTLHDISYPGPNDSYITFHVDQGVQNFDGETALKYARSRKSTSDFSRALRQQQIIEGVIEKVLSQVSLTKIDYLNEVYDEGMGIFETNISLKHMLGLLQYLDQEKRYFSFVYTAECDYRYLNTAEPGCVLNYADRSLFGGVSVMLPDGATPSNISYYRKTQDFAFRVVHNQAFLIESAPIYVFNAIDKQKAKSEGYNVNGVAGDLAVDLKGKGFLIEDILNAETTMDETIIYVPRTGSYIDTIETLRAFVDYKEVRVSPEYGSGGVSIVLGNDYLTRL